MVDEAPQWPSEESFHRGNCHGCGQSWVFGRVLPNLGDYGQFRCGACLDSLDDEDDGMQQSGGAFQRSCQFDKATGLFIFSIPIGLGEQKRSVRLVNDVMRVRFKSCGACLWLSSRVLSKFLESQVDKSFEILQGRRLLELGAGCGLPGIAMAQRGFQATITDLPELCPLLEHNVELNFAGSDKQFRPAVMPLSWGSSQDIEMLLKSRAAGPEGFFHLIIGSDIGYDVDNHGKLLISLAQLVAAAPPGRHVQIILAMPDRSDELPIFKATAEARGWQVNVRERVDLPLLRGDPMCSCVFVLELVLKASLLVREACN